MITQVIEGDTIWLKGEFKDRTGAYADPTSVSVKVYDAGENLLTTLSATKTDTGKYERDYLVPLGSGNLIFEFTGELGGYTATRRDTLDRQFRSSPA
jgi:hypothetical protein